MNKKIIIILGAPGAGKGTQAELLSEKLGFYHLETSKVIRKKLTDVKKDDFEIVGEKKYSLLEEKNKKDSGLLMSPPLITFWIKERTRSLLKEEQGIIMNGSPRTLYEGEELIPFLKNICGTNNIQVISIDLSEKESLFRNSHRKTCELIYHTMIYNKETEKLTKCPFDGSKLVIRKDDHPKIIKVRLKQYKDRTSPLIEFFKEEELKISKINGSPAPAVVFESILKALK
ncbi:MAG TPA: hypothetical protein ENH90_01115 [bacterium]|nr:hypothetical protein [bacterium]